MQCWVFAILVCERMLNNLTSRSGDMIEIENLPRNEEMNSDDMCAIEGGISFPSVLHGAPIKLVAPPQPVSEFDGMPHSSVTDSSTALAFPSDDWNV
jgi:hypothetical protein